MMAISKRAEAILFLAIVALFLIANRGAYRGFFLDDEFNNINWTSRLPASEYLKEALTPRFSQTNFRPVGYFYFRESEAAFGLSFAKYVAVIHFLHLLSIAFLWLLLRMLGTSPPVTAAACFFFGLHAALFDAVWKPSYVFDVLCGTFCLLSILLYAKRRWVFSFVAFWFAYKSKELAVTLPLILACYEFWFGGRKWKPLIPFFLASLCFGIQALILTPNKDADYTFHFTLSALSKTGAYYAGRVFLIPYLGLLLPLAALFARNRRTWFGLTMMGLFFFVLLFLPGRMESAYCYLPFAGLAIAMAGVAERIHPAVVVAFLLLWLPLDYHHLHSNSRATLAGDDEVRTWANSIQSLTASSPSIEGVIYNGAPRALVSWGIEAAFRYLLKKPEITVQSAAATEAQQAAHNPRVIIAAWDPNLRRLFTAFGEQTGRESYLSLNGATLSRQSDQLINGWYGLEGDYRWISSSASAKLWRPSVANVFELRVNVGPEMLQKSGPAIVSISLSGLELDPVRFDEPGWHTAHWNLQPGSDGEVAVHIRVTPTFHPSKRSAELGIAVGALGFVTVPPKPSR